MREQLDPAVVEGLGLDPKRARLEMVAGGSIARAFRLDDGHCRMFVKCLPADRHEVLDAERDGLERLASAGAVATPRVLGSGSTNDTSWLALEWIDMCAPDDACFARLGVQLAHLHRITGKRFGLDRDNFIGATPQPNTPAEDWAGFFCEHRLGFQLRRLASRERGFARADAALRRRWLEMFSDHRPEASLLHGDLWSGNVAQRSDGEPLVYDPAVHYGDRECDLAMADLFGGFDPAFYAAYRGEWPLPPGWEERRRFYQLYHLLNHANLFGGHYLAICRRLIDDLTAG